ncbi:MAG: transglutaminase-like domain-containing protein [Armatimonadota bacterium]
MKRLPIFTILLIGFAFTVTVLGICIKSIWTSIQTNTDQQNITTNSILPIDTIGTIPDAGNVAMMAVRVTGMSNKSLIINDFRQKAIITAKNSAVEYYTTANTYLPNHKLKLPVRDKNTAIYLKPGKFITISDNTIESKAREIIGDESSADTSLYKLWDWVNSNMVYDINSVTDRDASEILKRLKGRCEHYAILYVALARSVGIPSRIVAGLSYSNGSFGYHVWAESFIGEWIPVDPVDRPSFVNATHIKRSINEEQLIHDINTIDNGMLTVEIISYKYRFNIPPGILAITDSNYLNHRRNGKLMMYAVDDKHSVVDLSGRSDGRGMLYKVSKMQDVLLSIDSRKLTETELGRYPVMFAKGSFAVNLPDGRIAILPPGSQSEPIMFPQKHDIN